MITVGENSWVTLAEAEAYLSTLLNNDAWDDAEEPLRERALATAHGRLHQEGTIADLDQDDPPANLQRAQMRLALYMLSEDLLSDSGLEGFEELRVGPVHIRPRTRAAGALPADVRRELGDLLLGTSPMQFKILRG